MATQEPVETYFTQIEWFEMRLTIPDVSQEDGAGLCISKKQVESLIVPKLGQDFRDEWNNDEPVPILVCVNKMGDSKSLTLDGCFLKNGWYNIVEKQGFMSGDKLKMGYHQELGILVICKQ